MQLWSSRHLFLPLSSVVCLLVWLCPSTISPTLFRVCLLYFFECFMFYVVEVAGDCVMAPTMFNARQGWSTGTCKNQFFRIVRISITHTFNVAGVSGCVSVILFSIGVATTSQPSDFWFQSDTIICSTCTLNAWTASVPYHYHLALT